MESKFSITKCLCVNDGSVGKIQDDFIFLEAKHLCNFEEHKAAEGSTKMSFEWLD